MKINNNAYTPLPDLLSFASWEYDSSSATHASHSFAESLPENADSTDEDEKQIRLLVGGVEFAVDKKVFYRLRKLPWTFFGQHFVLSTSSELFEVLLSYLLFDSIPANKSLTKADVEELEPMAVLLGLTSLARRLSTMPLAGRRQSRSSSTSFSCKSSATLSPKAKTSKPKSILQSVAKKARWGSRAASHQDMVEEYVL